ncbi:MAG: YbhB/YbcL family Raf kinase inhibitor-like protein [candidate division KSB1 bacterium]|nr:YbhB/YbcL family Raf kinase inhibitor-like protein [candidate division KSB1 bacterium]MDZ7300635.1 YbhB/YbcL family Raf kinase inhibitor-like protein [candidate division KSB1 bacterium]MDZ7309772.1 YbhB/YbcL family Raf kinase inhibitor-like protein [candidate division KSB1 bacterium]
MFAMSFFRVAVAAVGLVVLFIGKSGNRESDSQQTKKTVAKEVVKMELKSSAFTNGKSIPTKYANTGVSGGQNISLPLEWSGVPAETKSFALAIVDRHPIANNWVHWFVINIPKSVNMLAEGASRTNKMPAGSKELNNTFGKLGYGGPQPPRGSGAHDYEITLYALNVENLALDTNTSLAAFEKALAGKVLTSAKMVGTFER